MTSILRLSIFFCAGLALAACSPGEKQAAEPAAPSPSTIAMPATPAPLPPIDTANASQFAQGGARLEALDFPRTGSLTVKGSVKGDVAPVYAVSVAKGQTLTVTFAPSNTNLYANVSDARDHSGAALHRGEVDGAVAKVTSSEDMTYVITPFQPRAQARRGETGDFSLTVTRD